MASEPVAKICDLPNEVLVSIFTFLPVTDLARVAATCERWHEIVTSFPRLWKGKLYRSERSPIQCPETRAVLHALPPFPRISIQSIFGFMVEVRYPRLILQVTWINVMKNFPTLRCEYLSIRLDIAGNIFTKKTTIDFERIQRLRVLHRWNLNFWAPRLFTVDYVARRALLLCPNLTHLTLRTDFVSGVYLETVEGLGRLQYLEIQSPGLRNLSFLRHCCKALQSLLLVDCAGLLSREFVHVGQLRNLRMLWLSACQFSEGHMAIALARLPNLESLHLICCNPIRDLSILRHCSQLRELSMNTSVLDHMVAPVEEELWLGGLVPCTDANERHLVRVMSVAVTAYDLAAALSTLKARALPETCLTYLAALRPCSQLRNFCCEFTRELQEPERLKVRISITFTSSA